MKKEKKKRNKHDAEKQCAALNWIMVLTKQFTANSNTIAPTFVLNGEFTTISKTTRSNNKKSFGGKTLTEWVRENANGKHKMI